MTRQTDTPEARLHALANENARLREELLAAREASTIKNELMVAQFERVDAMLIQLEEKVRNEEALATRLAEQLKETRRREVALEAERRKLKRMQSQLVEAEKNAALSSLVAGVAHEINTPVGIAVTAASHLVDRMNAAREAWLAGTLGKKAFEDMLHTANEAGDIIATNLKRAGELVGSFKSLAVDQHSEAKRHFALDELLLQFSRSMAYQMRKARIQLDIACPPGLELDSYPGALIQVVTNLVMNALLHAFPDGGPGTVSIVATRHGRDIRMDISDDGQGIAEGLLPHIFQPFITTARTRGGTGLGLNIVMNLITARLGGTISVRSREGEGTTFTLTIPKEHNDASHS